MAKEKEEKKTKNKKSKKILIIILVILILVGGTLFGLYKFKNKKGDNRSVVTVKVLDSLDEYGYEISDRDTKYYKSEFEVLKKLLNNSNVDEEAYSTQIARLFVIDLYTLSSKLNKYDIGGAEYFYKDKLEMYNKKVMDTLYSTVVDDTYGDRKQSLPEVNNITTVSTEKIIYELDEEKVDAYLVKVKWTYVSDMGYDDEASVVVAKEEGIRWSVVEFQPTLNYKATNNKNSK